MKIYTKRGDKGKTSLLGGDKVSKYDIRIEAYGTVDELNAHVGTLRAQLAKAHENILLQIQNDLFTMGSTLAATPKARKNMQLPELDAKHIQDLEDYIDQMESALPALTSFILAGRTAIDGQCHIARCVCRRAERRVVELVEHIDKELGDLPVQYLNRLSDFLFVLARKVTKENGEVDLLWRP
jgi:cob(I)alamin adenosyltransferase